MIHRRAASEYVLNRESIRYRQESFVEHLFVHKENPLKLEILHILRREPVWAEAELARRQAPPPFLERLAGWLGKANHFLQIRLR